MKSVQEKKNTKKYKFTLKEPNLEKLPQNGIFLYIIGKTSENANVNFFYDIYVIKHTPIKHMKIILKQVLTWALEQVDLEDEEVEEWSNKNKYKFDYVVSIRRLYLSYLRMISLNRITIDNFISDATSLKITSETIAYLRQTFIDNSEMYRKIKQRGARTRSFDFSDIFWRIDQVQIDSFGNSGEVIVEINIHYQRPNGDQETFSCELTESEVQKIYTELGNVLVKLKEIKQNSEPGGK